MLYSRRFSRKSYPIPDQNGESLYTFSVQNSAKTVPFAAVSLRIAVAERAKNLITFRVQIKKCRAYSLFSTLQQTV